MFGGLIQITDEQIAKVIDRVLTNERVEDIARRVAELLLAQLLAALQTKDDKTP